MATLLEIFSFVLLVTGTLIGIMANGFIAIINCIDWFRRRKLSPADLILSCLSLFRLIFLAILIQCAFFLLFFEYILQMRKLRIAYSASWQFVNTAALWFAAWLSVLYCVKIANFSHPLFLQMKRKFPEMVPWLLLGTVVFSAIVTTITGAGSTIISKCKPFESHLRNKSDPQHEMPHSCKFLIQLYIVPDFISFVVFLSSSILLLTSLWRHKNLLQNSVRDVSTEVHLNAIKALASFSILYVSSFIVEILGIVLFWMDMKDTWKIFACVCVITAYSSGHAIILIFANPKLKQESIKMLHQLKC